MKISISEAWTRSGELPEGEAPGLARLEERLRWAVGSYSPEVASLHITAERSAMGVQVVIRAQLRGRRTLMVSSPGADFAEALDHAAARVGAAIARRVHTDRILGS